MKKNMRNQELLKELQKYLPFLVYPTKYLVKTLLKKGISTNNKNAFKVIKLEDSGDIGGITCHIIPENSNDILIISLTHLKVAHNFPLKKQVLEYKRNRIHYLSK